ncbi:hypothetical protein K1W54_00735 [Micromonospora sp. CPCC 205371]|nr:hypothetical protein [Micromonospora sp. CPCC 205371]
MSLVYYLHSVVKERIDHLRTQAERDRGDGPVPTAIIIPGLAAAAVAVTATAASLASGWMAKIAP